jgi:Rrf2 family protein
MIKLSTKGRYGTRFILNLACRYKTGDVIASLKTISEEEEISAQYLDSVIVPLKNNKLIKIKRGAKGGYTLARPPSEIRLIEIIEALEGPISLVNCVEDDEYCHRVSICTTHDIWKDLSYLVRDYLGTISLQDLVKMSKKKSPKKIKR